MKKIKKVKNLFYSDTDPNGSYTGVCENEYDTPIQDADDL